MAERFGCELAVPCEHYILLIVQMNVYSRLLCIEYWINEKKSGREKLTAQLLTSYTKITMAEVKAGQLCGLSKTNMTTMVR